MKKEKEMKVYSIAVLHALWDELIRKFESEESDEIVRMLEVVEVELQKREVKSC